jgi:hypothetical protein
MPDDNQTPPTMPWPPLYKQDEPSPHLGEVDPSAFSSGLAKMLLGIGTVAVLGAAVLLSQRGCEAVGFFFPQPISGIQKSVRWIIPQPPACADAPVEEGPAGEEEA